MSPSPEAAAAVEELRVLGQYRIVDFGGHWRLGKLNGDSWYLCHISGDHWTAFNRACLLGLAMAKAQIADQAARQALPRKTFGASPASSAK